MSELPICTCVMTDGKHIPKCPVRLLIESQQATITEQAAAIVKCVRDEWNPLPVATDEIALDWFLQEYAALKEESCESG